MLFLVSFLVSKWRVSDFSSCSHIIVVYEQYRSIEPWLQTKEGKGEGQAEFLQTKEDRAKLDGMVRHKTRDMCMQSSINLSVWTKCTFSYLSSSTCWIWINQYECIRKFNSWKITYQSINQPLTLYTVFLTNFQSVPAAPLHVHPTGGMLTNTLDPQF